MEEDKMLALQSDTYDLDLPKDDDCWHLDEPREVRVTVRNTGRVVDSYRRVGINARAVSRRGDEVKVVVLDNGVEHQHPSLWPVIEPVFDQARDFDHSFEEDGKSPRHGGRIANRFNAHGTACAGLVAARQAEGSRIVGVAPNAYLIPVRISTNFEIESLVNSLRYAGRIGQVILLPRFLPESDDLTAVIKSIAEHTPIVCAAGNMGTASLIHPASLKETIAVGACNDKGYRSTYSQFGENLDVVAPSNDLAVEDAEIIRLDADEVDLRIRERREERARREGRPLPPDAPGQSDQVAGHGQEELAVSVADEWNLDKMGVLSIATTDNLGAYGYNYEPQGHHTYATGDFGFGGTSAAAAQVAGVVALMLSKNPDLTVDEIRTILRRTARVDCLRTEAGTPPDKPSPEFGYGLVDAAEAVKQA